MARFFSGKKDVYLEIAERYANYIRLGVLRNGDRLPSVRVAAGELGVNPNTVQKAYVHLEAEGMIRALPKKGAFVTYVANSEPQNEEQNHAIRQALSQWKAQGMDKQHLLQLLEEVYSDD